MPVAATTTIQSVSKVTNELCKKIYQYDLLKIYHYLYWANMVSAAILRDGAIPEHKRLRSWLLISITRTVKESLLMIYSQLDWLHIKNKHRLR